MAFLARQRLQCLLKGAWFTSFTADTNNKNSSIAHRERRYYRLSGNKRYLHFGTFPEERASTNTSSGKASRKTTEVGARDPNTDEANALGDQKYVGMDRLTERSKL